MTTKTCNQCGETKPLEDFSKSGKGHRRANCRTCYKLRYADVYHPGKRKKHAIYTPVYALPADRLAAYLAEMRLGCDAKKRRHKLK